MIFDEYSAKMIRFRVVYLLILFMVCLPNLIKKEIQSMKYISFAMLGSMISLLIFVMIQNPFIAISLSKDEW